VAGEVTKTHQWESDLLHAALRCSLDNLKISFNPLVAWLHPRSYSTPSRQHGQPRTLPTLAETTQQGVPGGRVVVSGCEWELRAQVWEHSASLGIAWVFAAPPLTPLFCL
jgi:hypothetical protein